MSSEKHGSHLDTCLCRSKRGIICKILTSNGPFLTYILAKLWFEGIEPFNSNFTEGFAIFLLSYGLFFIHHRVSDGNIR